MEPEFTNHIKTITDNSVSTYDTAARHAKENGAMYCRVFTCTPGDLDDEMLIIILTASRQNLSNCGELSLGLVY